MIPKDFRTSEWWDKWVEKFLKDFKEIEKWKKQ